MASTLQRWSSFALVRSRRRLFCLCPLCSSFESREVPRLRLKEGASDRRAPPRPRASPTGCHKRSPSASVATCRSPPNSNHFPFLLRGLLPDDRSLLFHWGSFDTPFFTSSVCRSVLSRPAERASFSDFSCAIGL